MGKNIFACPKCAATVPQDTNAIEECWQCEKALMIDTGIPASKIPKKNFYGVEIVDDVKYRRLQRHILLTIIAPMGQLDKDSLEFQENFAEYNNLPQPEEARLRDEREAAEYRNSAALRKLEQQQAQKPKCLTCGSTNVEKIGALERGASVAAWGLFSKKINKSFKCRNCGYTW